MPYTSWREGLALGFLEAKLNNNDEAKLLLMQSTLTSWLRVILFQVVAVCPWGSAWQQWFAMRGSAQKYNVMYIICMIII